MHSLAEIFLSDCDEAQRRRLSKECRSRKTGDTAIREPHRRASPVLDSQGCVRAKAVSTGDLLCPLYVDFVEEPPVLAPALGICGGFREGDSCLFALCGEDRRRKGDEFRQLSEVLGGGGQQELVFGAARPAQAQSVEPEDALQMSKEHLDLLLFAA